MDRDATDLTRRQVLLTGAASLAMVSASTRAVAQTVPQGADLAFTPATELSRMIRAKELSPVELAEVILDRTEALNPRLNAFLYIDREGALASARAAEAAVMRGDDLGLLHGIPVSIKDSKQVKGMPTTNGSLITGNALATEDAELVAKTRAAGGVIFAKTNLPAFAHVDVTENFLGPATANPWRLTNNSGGSSGGAGAACAAGLGPLHHGTDGGGSIRIPSDRCGVFGLKPSVGRIAHRGAIGAGVGIGHDGPMTRTVADAALLMNVWAGPLDADYLSLPLEPDDYLAAVAQWEEAVRGLRVGLAFDYGWIRALDPRVRSAVAAAAARFEEAGCTVEEVSPGWENPLPQFEVFWYTVAASKRPLFADHPAYVEDSLRLMMDEGAKMSGVDVANALEAKERLFQQVQRYFSEYDLLLSPVCAVPSWPIGQDVPVIDGVDTSYIGTRLTLFARMPFTPTFSLTGHPAASVPSGFTDDGLPIGLQIVGPRYGDARVLQAAAAFEAIQPWADRRPPLA
jgi:aspartyl-tRNA(Asn)/glutamyl-tRNA(Gln) amidotransferase subunit A